MRDTVRNPITDDEIVQCLERILAEWQATDFPPGDLRGMILSEVIARVKAKQI